MRVVFWTAIAVLGMVFVYFVWRVLTPVQCTYHGRARAEVSMLGLSVERFRKDTGRLPVSLEEMILPIGLGPYLREWQLKDPWERPLYYRVDADGKDFVLFSLGADGRLGGEGPPNQDIAYTPPEKRD